MSIEDKLASYTCVIERNGKIVFCSLKSGIKPLLDIAESGINVHGGIAYDKIVGKAAALMYVYLGVSEVHAEVASSLAVRVLTEHGLKVFANVLTDKIINRKGDGICPMEEVVQNVADPNTAFVLIKQKLHQLGA